MAQFFFGIFHALSFEPNLLISLPEFPFKKYKSAGPYGILWNF